MAKASRWLLLTIVLTEAAAVTCQFVQHTDPRFPLVYFTVVSGLLAGVVAALEMATRRHYFIIEAGRVAAAVGVVLSATIFIAIIAPASPTSTWFQPWDDNWVRIATVLFHGVAPVLVIAALLSRRSNLPLVQWIGAAYSWPLMYLACIAIAKLAFNFRIPYPFLSPDKMGWGTASIGIASVAAIVGIVAALLYYAVAARWRHLR